MLNRVMLAAITFLALGLIVTRNAPTADAAACTIGVDCQRVQQRWLNDGANARHSLIMALSAAIGQSDTSLLPSM